MKPTMKLSIRKNKTKKCPICGYYIYREDFKTNKEYRDVLKKIKNVKQPRGKLR